MSFRENTMKTGGRQKKTGAGKNWVADRQTTEKLRGGGLRKNQRHVIPPVKERRDVVGREKSPKGLSGGCAKDKKKGVKLYSGEDGIKKRANGKTAT